ncbi:MAG: hypothetical protein MI685_05505 [Chlorobiales bacterium]|nr:hypothetical protein [Chlorobiales bacterium]
MKYMLRFFKAGGEGTGQRFVFKKAVLVFILLQCFCKVDSLCAEERPDSNVSPFSYSLLLRGEGEWIDMGNSLLNPVNILERTGERYEGFMLGSALYRGLGGIVETELRLGYEYLAGESFAASFDDDEFSSVVNQLYYRTSSEPFSFVLGRKKVRWGVGYSYSPTDLITQLKNPEDPNDRLSRVEGADLAQLSYLSGSGQLDLVYFPDLDWDFGGDFIVKNRGGLRWYQLVDPFDLSFVGMIDDDGEWAAGLNTSVAVGDALELHAEYLYSSENNRRYPDTGVNPEQFLYPYLPSSGDGVHDVVVGGQYTFENNLNLTLEYLYRSSGYSGSEFDAYYNHIAWLNDQFVLLVDKSPAISGLGEAAMNFVAPQRKHYLFTRLYHPELVKFISFEMYSYVALEDGSGLFVVTPTFKGSDAFDVYFRLKKFWGERDSEFGLVPEDLSAIVGVSLYMGG